MYYTLEELSEKLAIPISEINRLIREKQIKAHFLDGQFMIDSNQFNHYIKMRKKYLQEFEQYLAEPIPEDIDIKDED